MPRWRIGLGRIARKIWFRAAVISLLSVLLALASAILAPLISYEFSLKIGSDAVDNILTILASSMLAVTTFSLAAMVAAFSRAAQQVTPRATQLLIEDKSAQNALSTFLGAFLFAIVGVIALSTDMYGAQGRVILYAGTILLIAWIAIILLRWIHTLTQFGRVEDAIRRIERATKEAIRHHSGPILLAGRPDLSVPAGAFAVPAAATGYVTFIDRDALQCCGEEAGAQIRICAPIGQMVGRSQALAWIDRAIDERCRNAIAGAFTVEPERSFDRDPRFGMVVLAEIGSRALSPAVNDSGTAVAALNAGQRLLEALADAEPKACGHASVIEPPLSFIAMAEDLILPIVRDGATAPQVMIRLQNMLGSVAKGVPPASEALRQIADEAYERVRRAEVDPVDLERIAEARRESFL